MTNDPEARSINSRDRQKLPVAVLVRTAMLCWLGFTGVLSAQSSDPPSSEYSAISDAMLAAPDPADWLMWRGSYSLSGHSALSQINTGNVAELELAWSIALSAGGNMTTPLVHDGVLFIADTDNILRALDARNGNPLWQYRHQSENLDGRRIGIALHGNKVIVPHNDLNLVALDVASGEVLWQLAIKTPAVAEPPGYYSLRGAPLIARGMVVQGVGATLTPEGGFIIGVELATGEEKWRFHTVARPDAPGGNSWNNLPLAARSGGSVWIPGSYDPVLDLVYFGTAPTYDTAPLLADLGLDGVNNHALFTNSTLALRPLTGELVWYFQHLPNDQWDLDWAYERQLAELPVHGSLRKVVFTAGKMAVYDVLDAASGQYLDSVDVGLQNMIVAIDPLSGDKSMHPDTMPDAERSAMLCPFMLGGRNWQAGAFNPDHAMLYLPVAELCMRYGPMRDGNLLSTAVAVEALPHPDTDGHFGRIQAIDMQTRQLAWASRERTPPTTAALSTAGGLVFAGFLDQHFKALDAATGNPLWQVDLGHLPSSFPISYAVDDRQYIAIVRGQPSRFIGSLYGLMAGFLTDQGGLQTPNATPALLVYALPLKP